MQSFKRVFVRFSPASLLVALVCHPALAQQPRPWEMAMQPAFSPVKQHIIALHDLVLVIITAITVLVAALLVYVMLPFNHKKNPNPSSVSHNTILEIAWTLVPVLILVIIAIPSFRLVYYEDHAENPAMTVKVTRHQWYWSYDYPDYGNLHFDSYIVPDKDLKLGQPRLLTVDNQLVLPVGEKIRILTTSADVIHSFFIPSLGVQRYAIPGRTIETWVEITKQGNYYGECNQICGMNHSRMPISIHAVSPADFRKWLTDAKTKYAENALPSAPVRLADADVSSLPPKH
jgi:cytochrome c oxidase subunit 2